MILPRPQRVLALLISIISLLFCAAVTAVTVPDNLKQPFKRPENIPFPANNPYSADKAALGKMLFFDPRLSKGFNFTCATCHNPSLGWENGVDLSIGDMNVPLGRHSPTILNVAWGNEFFWDGRAASLEAQARGPIEAEGEMNLPMEQVVERLQDIPAYQQRFSRVFGAKGLTEQNILKAIATYERTIVSGVAPFDRWVDGDQQAISQSAKQGFLLFTGKADCSKCHSGWNFTDQQFHDIGLLGDDSGRSAVTGNAADDFKFKTPSLRNINQRAPYMHDGSLPDLQSVIFHYQSGGIPRKTLSEKMKPLGLNASEIQQLVDFMNTLTGMDQEITLPLLPY